MINNILFMNGYGAYVWLSFAFTFLACAVVYYKTYKTLKKYEKDFAKELVKLSGSKRRLILEKSKVASQVFASYKNSI